MEAAAVLVRVGEVCRRAFGWDEPEDIADAAYKERYYEAEIGRGEKLLRRFELQGDILELGCAYGGMLAAAEKRGLRPVGIDIRAERIAIARQHGHQAETADAAELPFPEESFDYVISDSVIEHLPDLTAALRESHRVLRPGGWFLGKWGNSWLTVNGPHLGKCIGVPWVHLLVPERVIIRALELQKERGRWPASYLDHKLSDLATMGRTTRRDLRRAAGHVGFEIVEESSHSRHRIKHWLSHVRPFDELLAGELIFRFQKH